MLVDLHAHYPMHVIPAEQRRVPLHRWRRARLRALLVDLISRAANYQGPGGEPSVTAELLA
ncbi:MAG TPA: hypothetical protein VFN38_02165 [Gemmatimonadaceae bacterium]|nr:hypothetical protein [Gemmatimonadaceae bacterium]